MVVVAGKFIQNLPVGGDVMDPQEKEKKLKLMKFWLFGAFAIFFAAITIYFGTIAKALGVLVAASASVFTSIYYWIMIAVIAIACIGAWYLYKLYISKK